MNKHIVVQLPSGDWAQVPEGSTVKVYVFDDANMAELATGGADPEDLTALECTELDLDFGSGDACNLCGHPNDSHSPACPKARAAR